MDIKRDVVNELHRSARQNYQRRPVLVKGLNDLFQADLVDIAQLSTINKGFKFILIVINVFSKYVWAKPLKNKSGREVTAAMKMILKKSIPENLQTDLGKEFYNKQFQELMKKYKINHYSTFSNVKASVVERVNRTLKNLMWKEFSYRGNYRWIDILQKLVDVYNSNKHSTTGLKPIDVTKKHVPLLLKTVYNHPKVVDPKKPKFKIGDSVRISKYRHAFSKGYTPAWSNEIFKISQVKVTLPRTYLLTDINNEEIKGGFYEQELQKVKHPDVYLVEKVLKRQKKKMFVKWLGLDKSHNSWINTDQVV